MAPLAITTPTAGESPAAAMEMGSAQAEAQIGAIHLAFEHRLPAIKRSHKAAFYVTMKIMERG